MPLPTPHKENKIPIPFVSPINFTTVKIQFPNDNYAIFYSDGWCNSKNNISRSPNNNYDKEKNVNMYILGLEKDRVISQRRYQQQKRIKQQKYIEGLGLSELYKIYAPSLEINNYGHKNNIINNKRSYDYSYHKNKKPIYNYNYNYNYNTNNSNEYLPKVIPNRRLNPIKNNIKYY